MIETVIRAFNADHVVRITGLYHGQLRYWDATGFFSPTYADLGDGIDPIRLYSFKDLVGLKVLHVLRSDHKIPLRRLRTAAEALSAYSQYPWADLKIIVCNKEVSFIEPTTGSGVSVTGQYIMLPIIEVITRVSKSVEELNNRDSGQIGHSMRSRNIVHNTEVIAGTRVPVRAVQRYLAAGYGVDDILKEYPSLLKADVEAITGEKARTAA